MMLASGSQTVVRVPLVVHEGLQGGTRIDLLVSVCLLKKYFHSYVFSYRVLLSNSGIFVYFPC